MQYKNWLLLLLSTIVFILFGYFAINALNTSETASDNDVEAPTNSQESVQSSTSNTDTIEDEEEITRENDDTIIVIDDKELNKTDLDFLKYLQLAQIDYFEAEAEESWDEARRTQASDNTQIQNLIELNIMESLGEEKGYEITEEEINDAITEFQEQFSDTENYELAEELVGDEFEERFKTYITQRLIVDYIIDDLKEMFLQQFPEARDQEVAIEAGKEYQQLLADERSEHKIRIFNDYEQ